jgi:hypothetical protein
MDSQQLTGSPQIFNTRLFPSLQAAYMVDIWQKVAVSKSELLKKFTALGIMRTKL